jgi:hypothetical protein
MRALTKKQYHYRNHMPPEKPDFWRFKKLLLTDPVIPSLATNDPEA